MTDKSALKKRLMFIKGEDCYFITYNILILLDSIGTNSEAMLRDHRKLAFLVEFISDRRLVEIICSSEAYHISVSDKELLTRAYSSGLLRMQSLMRLLFTLEKKGFISINKQGSELYLFLNKTSIPDDFFTSMLFSIERKNIQALKTRLRHIRTMKLEGFIDKLFVQRGVITWDVY